MNLSPDVRYNLCNIKLLVVPVPLGNILTTVVLLTALVSNAHLLALGVDVKSAFILAPLPDKFKFNAAVKSLLTVVVPDPAPIETVVAAPPTFKVVATVFINANVDESVINDVVTVGDVPKTKAPDPVSPVTHDAKLALLGVVKNVLANAVKSANAAVPLPV